MQRKHKCWNCGDRASYRVDYGGGKVLYWCRRCMPVGTVVRRPGQEAAHENA